MMLIIIEESEMQYQITMMTLNRYAELITFWNAAAGLSISDDDNYDNLQRFFKRNPKLNFVVLHENHIIGTISKFLREKLHNLSLY